MKILFLGDISGKAGRLALKKALPGLRKKLKPDFVVANGENLAHGLGLTKRTFQEMIDLGIDLITSGDHVFDKEDILDTIKEPETAVIRPLNYFTDTPGKGHFILTAGARRLLVVNLLGQIFMRDEVKNPYQVIEDLLEDYALPEQAAAESKEKVDAILVDFHAEATSEKKVLGWLLDGRVSAVLGTHTHVQTNDEAVLPNKTAYISDVGMVGVANSSLGLEFEAVLPSFLNDGPIKIKPAFGEPVEINGVLIDVDNSSGFAKNIVKIREKVLEY